MSVELRKGQKVSLEKRVGTELGQIVINLNWMQKIHTKGLFGSLKESEPIDLDLGCLFELKNGLIGPVQALGKRFGDLNNVPYIALDGDDRTGESTEGEFLRINGNKIAEIQRVLVYTFIYEGATNWGDAKGVVTVKAPGNQDLIVRMDEYGSSQRMCAIAMLENVNDETFSVEKLVRFYDDHKMMDQAYGWGLKWVPGKKD